MARIRHKDYIFQKRLALRLPIDSFRFDFRYASIFHAFVPHQRYFTEAPTNPAGLGGKPQF